MPGKDKPTDQKLSRQQERDLDIEIQFLEGVVKRDRNYVRRGRFRDGL